MTRLLPCTQCSRHVRWAEEKCPFCGAPLAEAFAASPERPAAPSGLGRSALFAFAASAVVACSSSEAVPAYGAPSPPPGGSNGSGGAQATGGNPAQGGTGGAKSTGGQSSTGGTKNTGGGIGAGGMVGPVYGAPVTPEPVDAGDDGGDEPPPMGVGGGAHALYGLPAPPAPKK